MNVDIASVKLLPQSQSAIDKYGVIHEVIRVAATSKFTAFKQCSWRMKIDPGV